MLKGKKLNKLKIIVILVFFFVYFLNTISYIFLKDIPVLSSSYNYYINSGNSFFFPSLPYINLLWFLPKKYQMFQFSLGHLIDIFIIINLIPCIETGVYHYIKRVCLNEDHLIFIDKDSHSLGSKEMLFVPTQDPDIIFALKDKFRYDLDDKLLDVFIERNCRLNERFVSSYNHLRRISHGDITSQSRRFHRKSYITSNYRHKNLRISCYPSIFERYCFVPSKNHPHHPKLTNLLILMKNINGRWD